MPADTKQDAHHDRFDFVHNAACVDLRTGIAGCIPDGGVANEGFGYDPRLSSVLAGDA